jgi:hypothetical protein
MEVAATGILQVTEMELEHLPFQLIELDAGLLNKSFVDLLYFLCSGNGSKQKNSFHFIL